MTKFTATFWLNRMINPAESIECAPHSTLTRLVASRYGAVTIFEEHAAHVAWSRGVPVVWRIDGETELHTTN